LIIFLFSILFALFTLLIERTIGITLDYHPDSLTYLDFSDQTLAKSFVEAPLDFVGSFFYVIVGFLDKNVFIIITINILVFALTNLIIYSAVKNILNKESNLYFVLSLLLIFDPYRAHLSVHVLKDTLIIFSLIFTLHFINSIFGILSLFSIFFGILLRFNFYGYLPVVILFLKNKNIYILFFIFLMIVPLISFEFNDGDAVGSLAFRDFDKIPNFVNFQYPVGEILRGLTWPIIRVFNLAFIFHPIYILFIVQSLALTFLLFYNRHYLNFNIIIFYLVLAIIASSAPGYNSYLRYTQPVMTALYLWVISSRYKNIKPYTKKITNN
jgi:hypothetical protein